MATVATLPDRKADSGPLATWDVQEYAFPTSGTPQERLAFALRYAVLAPSSHNTQPWRFAIRGETIELYADRARALPAIDPDGRELLISCGAALFQLRVALRHYGYAAPATLLPDPRDADLLARVELGDWHKASQEEEELFHAIITRRTHRHRFERIVVPADLITRLQHEAARWGLELDVVGTQPVKERLAELIGQADRVQFSDAAVRREVASCVRDNRSRAHDGIPGYALGLNEAASIAEPLLLRGFDVGGLQGGWDHHLAQSAPVLVALGTPRDTPEDWLVAGEALARVLLRACAAGVYASFLNQPIEVAALRPYVRAALGMRQIPQVLLRMGYAAEDRPTPRRTVEEVLVR